jgi:hypothetical protein
LSDGKGVGLEISRAYHLVKKKKKKRKKGNKLATFVVVDIFTLLSTPNGMYDVFAAFKIESVR